jgi:galactoside 2-L-fucosyltransferase 1/2
VTISKFLYFPTTVVQTPVPFEQHPDYDNNDYTTEPPGTNRSGRYASIAPSSLDGCRLGNQLFRFAATLFVAKQTGRRPALPRQHKHLWIDRWFDVRNLDRVDDLTGELCPCAVLGESKSLAFDWSLAKLNGSRSDLVGKSLLVNGHFQSWRYAAGVERRLRKFLAPKAQLVTDIRKYFENITPRRWVTSTEGNLTQSNQSGLVTDFHRVGIHIRLDDIMTAASYGVGFTVPLSPYFDQAMRRIFHMLSSKKDAQVVAGNRTMKVRRVQFIVASDSIERVRRTFNLSDIAEYIVRTSPADAAVDIDITYSTGHDAGFDMIMLSMCDAVIMTTGTFGWWAGWLSNRPTIYYSDWPRPVLICLNS